MSKRSTWVKTFAAVGAIAVTLGHSWAAKKESTELPVVSPKSAETLPTGYEVAETFELRALHERYEQEAGRKLPYYMDMQSDHSLLVLGRPVPPKMIMRDRDGCVTVQTLNPRPVQEEEVGRHDGSEALLVPEVGSAFAHREGIVKLAPGYSSKSIDGYQGTVVTFGEVAFKGTFQPKENLGWMSHTSIPKQCQHYQNHFVLQRGTAERALLLWETYAKADQGTPS